ncbi:head maturation protease, ClpP-related [Antarcticimicrobium sediminis]|uniref:ATP-dependent Clp protease proteolytic subunit n=1 Tax=Antarcticimicrobium sediminis TaxID=2546227 RepID=A0A4R5EID4_9RHOB|nr:head maturation protease, ClpP-related [Antarcticimicrobium sediminis]TDE34134.1 Clp protease ClpP [Antarcticimicrobium sediminis]
MPILVDGELVLYGFVGDDFWDEGFTSTQVLDALAEIGADADVTVRINSGGGFSHEGIAIYNALARHKGRVIVEVDAIAASAASIIAMAGDDIVMRRGADMMIHDPSGVTFGTAADHEQAVTRLNHHANSMVGIYAEQSGEDPAAIRSDMKAEIWLNGEEAVARGYATATDDTAATDVAAFPYQIYSHAPKRLTAQAKQEGWRIESFFRPTASAVQPKAHQKETPTMAPKPEAADKTPATPASGPATGNTTAASAADVKARIKAITEDDAAQGREALAKHLAFDTDMPAADAIAALKVAASDAPQAKDDAAPDPAKYQASRSAAADLAQPAPGTSAKPKAAINTGGIYAARRAGKEA